MKYLVNLNGKNYEVDVTETKAEIVSTTLAPVAAAAPAPAPGWCRSPPRGAGPP